MGLIFDNEDAPVRKPRAPREKLVEDYLVKRCAALGLKCPKLPIRHWPDRLVAGHGLIELVETKRPKGGRLEKGQAIRFPELAALGIRVYVCYSRADVDAYLLARIARGSQPWAGGSC